MRPSSGIADALEQARLRSVAELQKLRAKLGLEPLTADPLVESILEARRWLAAARAPAPDPVNHPAHYKAGGIETIDFIEAKQLGFHLGNAVKYISRAGKKDPAAYREDLKKARWYLDRAIAAGEKA